MAPVAVLIAETTNKAEGGSSSRAQTMNQISYKTRESWLEGGGTLAWRAGPPGYVHQTVPPGLYIHQNTRAQTHTSQVGLSD